VSAPRVLHLIARMNMGGTATYLSNLMEGLASGEFPSQLVIGSVPRGEIEDPVVQRLGVIRIPELSREFSCRDLRARRRFQQIVDVCAPEIIHSHTFKAGLIARTIKSDAKRVHTFHGHHLYDPEFSKVKVSILNGLERSLAKKSDRLVSVGNRVEEELLEVNVGRRDQYFSIPPGITPLQLGVRDEVLARLNLQTTKPKVVWLGRFTEVKRPDRVIEIAKTIPECDFIMAGGGELERTLASSIPSNLFMVGWQKKEEMWAVADLALCTSDSEGMPLSLIEAQMSGVPVVSTDVGSVSEIVEDGITGKLAPKDSRKLADAIREVVQNISKGSEMSRAAKVRATRLFDVSVMVKAHEDLYRQMLG